MSAGEAGAADRYHGNPSAISASVSRAGKGCAGMICVDGSRERDEEWRTESRGIECKRSGKGKRQQEGGLGREYRKELAGGARSEESEESEQTALSRGLVRAQPSTVLVSR